MPESEWTIIVKYDKCSGTGVEALEKQVRDTRPGTVIRENFLEEAMPKLSFERAHIFDKHLFPYAPLVCLPFTSLLGELRCQESGPGRKSIPVRELCTEAA